MDANGDSNFHSGVTEFYGSANNGNAALDYDGSGTYDGGTFLAVGASGTAQTPSTGTYVAFGATATAETGTGATQGFGGGMDGQRPGGTAGTQSGTSDSSESAAAQSSAA